MEAYRDQYATIFKNGKGVAVIGISTDADTVQANWARDAHFPVFFASDPDAKVGKLYDVMYPPPNANFEKRFVFVIDPTGKITHVMAPFKEMVEDSYTELKDAVDKAGKP
jgi:peroxiredoxin Q/BCP